MLSDNNEDNGWKEWRRHILAEIQRLNNNLEKLETRNSEYMLKTSIELSRLKVWSGVYGAVAGVVAAIVFREVITRW